MTDAVDVLPDLLLPGLRVVFCGTAAGTVSALRGAYYAGPGNRFWATLAATGLTPRRLAPEEFPQLLRFAIGLTDLAKSVSGADVDLPHHAFDPTGLVETHCHADPALWLLENPGFVSGANYRWFRDQFAPVEMQIAAETGRSAYDLLNEMAAKIPAGSEGLVLLPCLMGAMAPTWNAAARGTFAGFTLAHGRGHFVRAVLEASAYAVRDIVDQMRQMGLPLEEIRAVGGGSRSRLWRQIKADVTGLPVTLPQTSETTALGAAMLALVGIGAFGSLSEAAGRVVRLVETVEPDMAVKARYEDYYQLYRATYFAMLPVFEQAAQKGL